jgi:hypothetical protein
MRPAGRVGHDQLHERNASYTRNLRLTGANARCDDEAMRDATGDASVVVAGGIGDRITA